MNDLDLTRLELSLVDFASTWWPEFKYALPTFTQLTHLACKAGRSENGYADYEFILQSSVLPALTHLNYACDPSIEVQYASHDPLAAVLPQLRALRLEESVWHPPYWECCPWATARSLEHLRVVETRSEPELSRHVFEGNVVRGALQALPGSLDTLDLATEHDGVVHACEAVLEAFERGWSSVAELKVLRLPTTEALENEEWSSTEAKVLVLDRVARVAVSRGVRVDRVDVVARFGHALEF